MASVLSVVASSPAQAANTSGEHLIDTNGDKKPDSRQFAGAHRYITAQLLADAYAANAGSPSTVIIASGETEVDAVAASGLAGNLNAPVLLTRSSMLPHNVARYIDTHNVTDVIIVGGSASVSDAVQTAIEALGPRPKVERVSGADRYATAAAIGDRLGGPNPTWCGSEQSAALLVNGGDAGRADAIASGPIAFGLGLPVLLTGADELPQSTVDFLTDNKVEHVVIVGGATAVPDSLRTTMIEDIGVVSVRRIAGADAAATSVMLAQEMHGKCAAVLNGDPDKVALVNRSATADGIAAAPAMGYGLGSGPIPVLLVDDTLPSAVSDYLASTAEVRGGMKTHLGIVAVGGTAVVSADVMTAAVAAAKTSPKLTATIGFNEKANAKQFTVTYSDDVKLPEDASGNTIYLGSNSNLTYALANGTAFDPTLYEVNGRRIEGLLADDPSASVPETQVLAEKIDVQDRTIVVTLSHELKDGDVISVVGGAKIGDNGDMRPLEAASHTVSRTAPAADRTAPTVEIVTGAGETMVSIFMVEAKPLTASGSTDPYIAAGGVTLKRKGATSATSLSLGTPKTGLDSNRPGAGVHRYDVSVSPALAVGDVIQVARNTFRDTGNRGNSLKRFTVAAAATTLKISSVSIGEPAPKTQASVNIKNEGVGNALGEDKMTVTALKSGAAKGVSGNGWVIYGLDDSAGTTRAASADIDVDVDMKHRVITYTVKKLSKDQNSPTLYELASALSGNEQFKANFSVTFISSASQDKSDKAGVIDAEGLVLSGGSSQVAMQVHFNRLAKNSDLTPEFAQAFVGVAVPTSTYTIGQLWAMPDDEVNYTYTTCDLAACSLRNLPQRVGSRVVMVDGKAEILRSLRLDASLKPFDAPSGPGGVSLQPNNAPTFTEGDTATRSVAENTAAGTDIGAAVAATDADSGDTLTYSLGGTDAASFDIDTATGQIKTKAALDYETKTSYSVTVSVSDGNDGTDSIDVTISVTDVAEPTGPAFPNAAVTLSVAENTAAGTDIGAAVAATHPDGDTITYSLGGTDAASFDIDTATGQIKTKAALNFEVKSSYSVTVTATAGTDTATVNVTINVTDVDEAAPIWGVGGMTRSVDECATYRSCANLIGDGGNVGAPVAIAGATGMSYALSGTHAGKFSIDAATGQITAKVTESYKAGATYWVVVTATDENGGSADITVQITAAAVNQVSADNAAPTWARQDYTFYIAENQDGSTTPKGLFDSSVDATDSSATATGRVVAGDVDVPDTARTYEFVDGSFKSNGSVSISKDKKFSLAVATGTITYIGSGEDYEALVAGEGAHEAFELKVHATSGTDGTTSKRKLHTVTDVTVRVTVVNDNDPPVFNVNPVTKDLTAAADLPENETGRPTAVSIHKVSTTDPDRNDHNTRYSLSCSVGGTANGYNCTHFSVDESTGQITYRDDDDDGSGEDYEHSTFGAAVYTLTVNAADSTNSEVNSDPDFVVTVTVTDEKEPPAVIGNLAYDSNADNWSWSKPQVPGNGPQKITAYSFRYRKCVDTDTASCPAADTDIGDATWGSWTNLEKHPTLNLAATSFEDVVLELTADTIHQVQVRATNADGDGKWSSSVLMRTPAASSS